MTTLAALVAAVPDPGHGRPTRIVHGPGVWRLVVEIADPGAGSAVEWFDITNHVAGWSNQRGADQYAGRYRASVVDMDLWGDDDSLAPWNTDTSAMFGVHVPLGPGLILRAGFIRVVDDTVLEWLPRFTNRVERWGDAAYGKGRARRFPIVARDLLTALVSVPIPASSEENWSERVDFILTQAGWAFGSYIWGATFDTGVDVLTIPARPAQTSALNELAATLDPAGLCYYTDRTGLLVVRPTPWDTFHAAAFAGGADGNDLALIPTFPVSFTYLAGDDDGLDEWAAYAIDGFEPFGFDKTEDAIVNHVVIVGPGGTFDDDDPISIQRYDRKSFQATWIQDNDVVAADLLTYRANAIVEAHPLDTSIDLQGFMPGPAGVDYLGVVQILHRNTAAGPTALGNGWVRQYTERCAPRRNGGDTTWELSIVVDIYNVDDETAVMLPVEDLTLVDVTDTSAEFSWTNPSQVITPTNTQIRVLNPASLWATVDYPILGVDWGALEPSTAYEFQVRLIRVVDGLITNVSPSRSIMFTTDPTTVPDIDGVGDDGDTDVTFPEPSPGCTSPDIEWQLQDSPDTTTWTTVASGTITTPPWEVTIPDYAYDGDKFYRIRSREVCAGVPGAWVVSNLYVGHCTDPPALGTAPFNDADCLFYFPAICPPDNLVEAFSEDPATKGYAYDDYVTDGDGNVVLVSAGEGIVAYGPNPVRPFDETIATLVDDATVACKVLLTHQPDATVILFSAAGLRLQAVANGAVWSVNAQCVNATGAVTNLVGADPLAFGAWYDIAITHDTTSGDVILYVDGGEQDTAAGVDNDRHNPGAWGVGIAEASLITNCAVWDRAIDAADLPGYVAPDVAVTIDKGASQADPTSGSTVVFDVVFADAVTGFATGDITLSGTAGATTAVVSGAGSSYTVTVSGMHTAGTVIASIAAGVCTSIATGGPNLASTSTDNSVAWTVPTLTVSGTVTHATNLDGAADVFVQGNYAYVTAGLTDRLTIVDISNPAAPSIVGSVNSTNLDNATGVWVVGNYAYVVANQAVRLQVVDVTNKSAPTVSGMGGVSVGASTNPSSVYVQGNYAYVTRFSGGGGVSVVNISNPASISVTGAITDATTLSGARGIWVDGNYAYVAVGALNKMTVVDVSNPASPTVAGSVTDATKLAGAHDCVKVGNYAYCSTQTNDRLVVIDVSNPAAPSIVGDVTHATNLNNSQGLAIAGAYAYQVATPNRVTQIDISNPAAPSIVTSLLDNTNFNGATQICHSAGKLYVSCISSDRLSVVTL